MASSPIEEIKNRLDIAEVVGEYVQLQKAGANFRALCPFHAEKSPSFFVSPVRQSWHCFGGCGEGGDIFKFIMKVEGVEFGDALRLLAKKAGVELPQRDPRSAQWETERKRLLEILERACLFFEKQLAASSAGQEVQKYLKERGVQEESTAKWRLGYAPDSQLGLHDFLVQSGYRSSEIGRAGLLTRSGQDTFDRFRGRIIFPVFDLNSQVAGFGGRVFGRKEGEDLAKYVNTSSTPVYDKGRILYGLDKAKLAIRRQDFVILVEGYMDAILMAQAGWENVVATSGTALTENHLLVLKRYASNLYAAFDRDEAGEEATKRGIELALQQGFQVRVVAMPAGKDPADTVLENPEMVGKLVEQSQSVFDFFFEQALSRHHKTTPEGKRAIGEALLPVIRKIPNSIERAHWIQRLARELDVKEEDVQEELLKIKAGPSAIAIAQRKAVLPKTRNELLEERALSLLFRVPEVLGELQEPHLQWFSIRSREILAGMAKNPSLEFSLLEQSFPADTVEFLRCLAMTGEMEEEAGDAREEFLMCVAELKEIAVRFRLDEIAKEIQKAEEARNGERVRELAELFSELSRQLQLS